jgi:isopenicillin N synthase-like dioxygenase
MSDQTALPLLDMSEFRRDPSSTGGTEFVEQLRDVVHNVGFFYVTGHGVPEDLADRVHEVARKFFALPEIDRLEIENIRSPQFRGYTRLGHEVTNGRADLREQVDIGHEMPAREVKLDEPQWLRLRGPNLWPSALPEFRSVFTDWTEALEVVGETLLRGMALALGQRADQFEEVVSPPEVLLKVIRYVTPPDDGSVPSESISARQGVGAHRDTGFLSFVHQDDVGGLQVERDGHLVDVPAIRGALVVNVGEMFQLVTGGYFKATVHRVVSPPPGIERISIAYFFNPKLEATLAPLELPEELAALAPGGASADPGNPIFANYGDNSLKVRLRAHPDVAELHHADLLASDA